jgi:hypothetical protein
MPVMTKRMIMWAALIIVVVASTASTAITVQASTGDQDLTLAPNQTNVDRHFAEFVPVHAGVGDTDTVLPGHTNISHAMTTHSSGVKIGFGLGLMVIGVTAVLIFLSRWIVDYRRRQTA